ncbi:MAG: DUF72 domain-containing protein [Candidatus Thorarchaeota archaeon SMTZ1-83]|nr:MAG: hypothetical protein AM324_11930 [Candidatus Thorarchaeota archaeon SMTZ1-83]
MRKGLHIGTSGWSYVDKTGWLDVFYQSRKSLLQQYLAIFETAEINSTFYSLPRPTFVKHLANVKGEKFFTAKIPRKVTHDHRLSLEGEGGEVLDQFFSLMKPLEHRLAALLIQLPPWEITKMADLETFLSSLDSSFRFAIEFRDESWLSNSTYRLLEEYGVAYVVVDEPKLPTDLRVTADLAYIRWHGHGTRPWYNYKYSIEELEKWKPRLDDIIGRSEIVLGYFNNHFSGNAPLNALQMLDLMGMISKRQNQKLDKMLSYMSVEQTRLDDF